jgi:hypothetical protein
MTHINKPLMNQITTTFHQQNKSKNKDEAKMKRGYQ